MAILQLVPTKNDVPLWDYTYTKSSEYKVTLSYFVQQVSAFYWCEMKEDVQHIVWTIDTQDGWSFLMRPDAPLDKWKEKLDEYISKNARLVISDRSKTPKNVQIYKNDENVWNDIEERVTGRGLTINPGVQQALRFYWFVQNYERMQCENLIGYNTREYKVYSVDVSLDTSKRLKRE